MQFCNFIQVHLYQLLGDAESSTDGARLVGVRLISAARSGWEVFTITDGKLSLQVLHAPQQEQFPK